MAQCDGQHLGHVPPRAANQNAAAGEVHTDESAETAKTSHGAKAGDTAEPSDTADVCASSDGTSAHVGTASDTANVIVRSPMDAKRPASTAHGDGDGDGDAVCGCHHRATPRGALVIEKDPLLGVVFRHADGSVYGNVPEPSALDVQTKLFSALRHLGFKEREVRAVLAELRAHAGLRGASLQDQLREALRRLRPPQARP
jgi:Holliday junction resolvase RuvA-like protein